MIKHGFKLLVGSGICILLAAVFYDASPFFLYFMTPILAISGLFYIVKGKYTKPKYKPPSLYTMPKNLLLACIICLSFVAYVSFTSDGSLAGIIGLPFVFALLLLIPATIISYVVTYIRNN